MLFFQDVTIPEIVAIFVRPIVRQEADAAVVLLVVDHSEYSPLLWIFAGRIELACDCDSSISVSRNILICLLLILINL